MPIVVTQNKRVPVSAAFSGQSPDKTENSRLLARAVTNVSRRKSGQPPVDTLGKTSWSTGVTSGLPKSLAQPASDTTANVRAAPESELSQPRHSWSEMPENIVPSAVNTATGLWDMVTHPQRTAETLVDAAQGGVDRIMPELFTGFMDTYVSPRSPETKERQRQVSGAVGQSLKDRYWGLENIKNTMITDPVGIALDIGGIAAGGLGMARGPLAIGSRVRLAEAPAMALGVGRPAIKKVGQTMIDEIGTPAITKVDDSLNGLGESPGHLLTNFTSPAATDLARENLDGGIIRKANDYEIYNPPEKPQRPFSHDYKNGAEADATGKLTKDMDGRKMGARNIFGRQTLGGPDVRATAEQVAAIGEEMSGSKIRVVPRQDIEDGAHGVSYFDPYTGKPRGIKIADDLPRAEKEMTTGHEVGHFIDEAAGQIPAENLDDELRFIYGTTATGKETRPPRVGPEKYYQGEEIPRELMTEAIRTYMVNPNWIKTVAPRTAARIREWVNTHPELSKIVQFNSLAAGLGGLALGGQSENSQARDLPRPEGQQPFSLPRTAGAIRGMPIPFELKNRASQAGSYGIDRITDSLFQHGLPSQPQSAGKFNDLARALLDLQSKQKTRAYGGPR